MAYSVELRNEILTRIKNGEKISDISRETGVSIKTIYNWENNDKTLSPKRKKNTVKKDKNKKIEELMKNEQVPKIIKYKELGFSDAEIAKLPDIKYDQPSVSRYVRKCKELGLISEEEIKNKREIEKLKKNEQVSKIIKYKKLGFSDTEIAKMSDIKYNQPSVSRYIRKCKELGLISEEEIKNKTEIEKNEQISKIIKYKKLGFSDTEIAKMSDIKYSQPSVSRYVKKCKELGLISEDKTNKDEKERKLNNEEIDTLFGKLVLGYEPEQIKKDMNITSKSYNSALEVLIKSGRITNEEIEEYQEKRNNENKVKILDFLKKGFDIQTICDLCNNSLSITLNYIEEIKKELNISDNDIITWQNQGIIKRGEAVLYGLRQGLNDKEIIDRFPNQKLNISIINDYKEQLLNKGKITQYDIAKYRSLRKKGEKEQETKNDLKEKFDATTEEDRIKKENKRELEQKLHILKKEIGPEIRYNIKVSKEKDEKIREYINLCNRMYTNEKISKLELEFLRNAMKKTKIGYKDIVKFSKRAFSICEYEEALNMIRSTKIMNNISISKEEKEKLQQMESVLVKTCKVQKAEFAIKKGNTDVLVISETTGLSKEEINILKIKLSGKPFSLCTVQGREKVLETLLSGNILNIKMHLTDLEMEDIKDQAEYRKIEEDKRDVQAKIKQDSSIRLIVLYTKLGKNMEYVANKLKIKLDEVQEKLELALQVGLITRDQLKGMEILKISSAKFKQMGKEE